MKEFLKLLENKYFLWAFIGMISFGGFFMRSCQVKENERLQTYNRQLQGQLSDKEREMQKLRTDLGVSESELLTEKELNKRLNEDKEEQSKSFDKFKKDHQLAIKSRDKTIASLKQKLSGGTTVVDLNGCENISQCLIGYSWSDPFNRFKLKDPNIFEKDNEIFESEQIFKIYGEVWQQKDGSLQTRRLVLREVVLGEDGEYTPVPNGKADIIDSKFEYRNPPSLEDWTWRDLFKLRVVAFPSLTAFPDNGRVRLGVGAEFLNWKGLGINTHTAFDFKEIEKVEQRLGLSYSPRVLDTELNLAVGLSVGTPFVRPLKDYSFNIDLIFYINN